MKREILFRGIASAYDLEGQWVYGSFVNDLEKFICAHNIPTDPELPLVPVDIESLGQYTGLQDKNGVRIFEGDIVLGTHKNQYKKIYEMNYIVVYSEDRFWLRCIDKVENVYPKSLRKVISEIEVIGNQFENSEFIKTNQ